jgi:L-aspartate oxidase
VSDRAPAGGDDGVDLLVLGSGVAGLSVALEAARLGLRAVVLTKAEVRHATTAWAQGGVAAALTDDDSADLHEQDTLVAGAGLCDREAVRALVVEGPERVLDLIANGARFDRLGPDDDSPLALAREGGHSLARVVHAGGDATGWEIERALVDAVDRSPVDVRERWFVLDVIVEGGRCRGVVAVDDGGLVHRVRARHVVLASGGMGQLFAVTTNPALSTGDGSALALRAGVAIADVEFMQFHPTALHHPAMPRPLLSEALRGDGAVLRDDAAVAFMGTEHELADLAPRDVVSRAISRRLLERGLDHLWLDATMIERFPERFPTIWAACQNVGLDPRSEWLPIAPAAHYHCGGVLTDLVGATSLPGLWAAGEVACSGIHGANRLASNSLLDGLVFGVRAARAIAAGVDGPSHTGPLRGLDLERAAAAVERAEGERSVVDDAVPGGDGGPVVDTAALRAELQRAMSRGAGVLRSPEGLAAARSELDRVGRAALDATGTDGSELRNLVAVGRALVDAAVAREESRGAHTRTDHARRSDALLGRFVHLGREVVDFLPLPAEVVA